MGLDFGRPTAIGQLVYVPRNRDNFIRKGDSYELFYASERGWESLGRQIPESDSLVYEVPCGTPALHPQPYPRGGRPHLRDGGQAAKVMVKYGGCVM